MMMNVSLTSSLAWGVSSSLPAVLMGLVVSALRSPQCCLFSGLPSTVTGSCDDISAADFVDVQVSCV